MITDVSRSLQRNGRGGGGVTQPLQRVARPFVVSQAVSRAVSQVTPALPGRGSGARAGAGMAKLTLLLAVFALLNAGDLVSTYAGLHSGMHEGNPLMSELLGHYGFAALIGYKLLVIVAVSVGIVVLRSFSKGIATATIWVCNALVCAVVILNVLQFVAR